jgi:hypothetical protein
MKLLFRISYIVVIVLGVLILIPNLRPARTVRSQHACVSYLHFIQEKKAAWAKANGKNPDAEPTVMDLFGSDSPRVVPACPEGGIYTIGNVGTLPRCSAGHVCPTSGR